MARDKKTTFKYEQNPKLNKVAGKESIIFENPPFIIGEASVAGKKEGEGPLGTYFDKIEEDSLFGVKHGGCEVSC